MRQQPERQCEVARTLAAGIEKDVAGNRKGLRGGVADDAQGKERHAGVRTNTGDPGSFHVHGQRAGGSVQGSFFGGGFEGRTLRGERPDMRPFVF